MTDATELDEAAIRARLEAATPGPWHGSGGGLAVYGATIGDLVAEFRRRADATFVRHARTDVERLLATLEKARDEIERLETRCNEEIAYTDEAQSERDAWKDSYEDVKAEVERLHFDLDREAHARQAAESALAAAIDVVGQYEHAARAIPNHVYSGAWVSFAADLRAALATPTTPEETR